MTDDSDDAEMVVVCDACGSISCWEGYVYCENYRTAGTRTVPRSEAKA